MSISMNEPRSSVVVSHYLPKATSPNHYISAPSFNCIGVMLTMVNFIDEWECEWWSPVVHIPIHLSHALNNDFVQLFKCICIIDKTSHVCLIYAVQNIIFQVEDLDQFNSSRNFSSSLIGNIEAIQWFIIMQSHVVFDYL